MGGELYNLEAELGVIGSMLTRNVAIMKVSRLLTADDFSDKRLATLYGEILACYEREGAADMILVSSRLKRQGLKVKEYAALMSKAVADLANSGNGPLYAKEVKKFATLRRVAKFGEEVSSLAMAGGDGDIEGFFRYLSDSVSSITSETSQDQMKMPEIVAEAEREMVRNEQKESIGIKTGFLGVDRVTGGVQNGHIWIIGGYASTGKTAVAINMALHMMMNGLRVHWLSNEMTALQTLFRLWGLRSGLAPMRIQHNRALTVTEYAELDKARSEIDRLPLTFTENVDTVSKAVMSINAEADNADVFFVDYITNFADEKRSEYEKLTEAARALQSAAKKSQRPVIALSQVNNESAKNPSQVMGFKGSGHIAAVADVAIELYRDKEESPEKIIFDIKKNRHGATRKLELALTLKSGRIYDHFTDV